MFGAEWSYDVSKINIPYLMVSGTGYTDAGEAEDITAREGQGICQLWSLTENYSKIGNDAFKVMARKKDQDHGGMLRYADGYMTVWFMYHLKGDEGAGRAFIGDSEDNKCKHINIQTFNEVPA